MTGHLETFGLLDRFRLIRCRDDVVHAKPAPDLYLSALEGLGVSASEAIAIEDSPNGSVAAKAAGLYVVAVPNGVTRQLQFERADLVLTSLADRRPGGRPGSGRRGRRRRPAVRAARALTGRALVHFQAPRLEFYRDGAISWEQPVGDSTSDAVTVDGTWSGTAASTSATSAAC